MFLQVPFTCPKCGTAGVLKPEAIDRVIACPGCAAKLRVQKGLFEPTLDRRWEAASMRALDKIRHLLPTESHGEVYYLLRPIFQDALQAEQAEMRFETVRKITGPSPN
jgi:hypothetical protein